MKAITLTEPYATLVAIGAKTIETRGWKYRVGGDPIPMLIHAAKGMKSADRDFMVESTHIRDAMQMAGVNPYTGMVGDAADPFDWSDDDQLRELAKAAIAGLFVNTRSRAVAYAMLERVEPMTTELIRGIDEREHSFGNYAVGRFAWYLSDVERIEQPYKLRGSLGMWNFSESQAESALEYCEAHDPR